MACLSSTGENTSRRDEENFSRGDEDEDEGVGVGSSTLDSRWSSWSESSSVFGVCALASRCENLLLKRLGGGTRDNCLSIIFDDVFFWGLSSFVAVCCFCFSSFVFGDFWDFWDFSLSSRCENLLFKRLGLGAGARETLRDLIFEDFFFLGFLVSLTACV